LGLSGSGNGRATFMAGLVERLFALSLALFVPVSQAPFQIPNFKIK
jgi:hypothetical protein